MTYPQCPYCGSYEHTTDHRIFSCGTTVADPRKTQTSLCIDREVAKEASEGLEKVANALGLREWLLDYEGDYPAIAEQCIERIRDLKAPAFKPCRDCHTPAECRRRGECIMEICPACEGNLGECEMCEGTGKF